MKIFENLDLRDLDKEVWKTIEEYPDYQISNLGRVKSFKNNCGIDVKILKQIKDKNGYLIIDLYKNGKSKLKKVHRLVYETHTGKLEEDYDAHHVNEDKENNFVGNLETKEHGKHSKDHHKDKIISKEIRIKMSNTRKERYKKENHPNYKITNQKIIDIVVDIEKGDLTQVEIAKKHGVGQTTVSCIKTGKLKFYN